ncbi:GNAT family N-acetyltransferase [Malacoplasma muris]|uniref:GNAT family N-acetyltransferase n=1 Tax=Malacoplasma muris TaxID=2119 RepID=UPI00398EE6ED
MLKTKINHNDIEKIKEIELINFPNNNYSYDELNHFNNNDNFKIIVTKEHDILVAYSIIFIAKECIEIYKIFVDKNYRKKQIATKIIEDIKIEYNRKIIIEVSDRDNTIEFYKKNGFKLIHLRKNYYNDKSNAYIMEWSPK